MSPQVLEAPPPAQVVRQWPPAQGEWTYEDWLKLPDDDGYRYEVLDGVLHISPPPRPRHQTTSGNLSTRLDNHVRAKALGRVWYAPVGVRLPNQPVPVQPDIFFIAKGRLNIVGEDHIEGAPDLVVEILSPSNWLVDRREKFQAYEKAGVREYWLADYRAKTVEVFVLQDGEFTQFGNWGTGETARSQVLEGFEIQVDKIFEI
ncbi:MAG: Uma2 family endonuclease [Chloroflexi bacterium]|nr:Uma2 family endonuclease [Chloroflexota bacterium]